MTYLNASWNAPHNVHAFTTTRMGGVSQSPYDSNNLAQHVDDNERDVLRNRQLLVESMNLPSHPIWLEQTHSTHCVVVEDSPNRLADAAITRKPNTVLAILTADCLPIVISNIQGTEIAAIHAGWRGLANGIIESTLNKMHSPAETLLAWIGPAICQRCYETGTEVQSAFLQQYPYGESAFSIENNKCYANLPKLAELILSQHHVKSIHQSNQCTFEAKDSNAQNKYYSYRYRAQTGRIATLIWFKEQSL